MRLGIIDIGSNTVRLVIWDIYGKGFRRIVDEIKDNVRLGENFNNEFEISDEKVNSLINTLKRFKYFTESLKVDRVIVVASEAIRLSKNRDELLYKIKKETTFETIVLDDTAESYLDYKGVTGSMEVEDSLMVDISGTNTELVWIKNNEQMESICLPFGTLNLTQMFNLNQIVSPKDHTDLEEFLLENLTKIDWIRENTFKTIILVGGSARTIARIDRKKKRYPLSITHNYTLNDLDINNLYYSVLTKDVKQRNKIQGLNKDRSDIILAALAMVYTLQKVSKVQEIRISGNGLREGIVYETTFAAMDTIENMLDSTIYAILARHDMDVRHSEHVYKLTKKMYDGLSPILKLHEDYQDVLKTAAMLHDVGMSIRYYDHEKHSFYIILNSEINGLNQKEILLSALAASYHRNNNMDLLIANFTQIINKLDVINAEKIGLLINLAECFEKNLNNIVYDVKVEIKDDNIILAPYADREITTEMLEANKVVDRFKEIFKKDLIFTPVINNK